jgi:hypothetical protein
MLERTRLENPLDGCESIFESLMTSLFFLQMNVTGLLPVMALHGIDSWAPIFVLGINNGAISGLSGYFNE